MSPVRTLSGSPHEIVAALKQELSRLEGQRLPAGSATTSGYAALDRLLPGGGFARGTLVEWLAADEASGAGTLALLAARATAAAGGAIVVVETSFNRSVGNALRGVPDISLDLADGDEPEAIGKPSVHERSRKSVGSERQGGRSLQSANRQYLHFYPPAAAGLGVDLERLIVVRAANERDELWALYQVLRSPGVAAVWARRDKLEWRWFRRLQLAAETGGAVGHLLRPASVRGQPTWSQLQLLVEPLRGVETSGRRLRVELVRCRTAAGGGARGGVVEVEIDETTGSWQLPPQDSKTPEASPADETHPFALAAELAPPKHRRKRPA